MNLNGHESEGPLHCLASLHTCLSVRGTSWPPAGASGECGVAAAKKIKTIQLQNVAKFSSRSCEAGVLKKTTHYL